MSKPSALFGDAFGRHYGAESLIKRALKDPDSMEVFDTTISPIENGEHIVWVDYRARNSFGAMVVGSASTIVDTETCEAHSLIFE